MTHCNRIISAESTFTGAFSLCLTSKCDERNSSISLKDAILEQSCGSGQSFCLVLFSDYTPNAFSSYFNQLQTVFLTIVDMVAGRHFRHGQAAGAQHDVSRLGRQLG
jgi:hypothetical protein